MKENNEIFEENIKALIRASYEEIKDIQEIKKRIYDRAIEKIKKKTMKWWQIPNLIPVAATISVLLIGILFYWQIIHKPKKQTSPQITHVERKISNFITLDGGIIWYKGGTIIKVIETKPKTVLKLEHGEIEVLVNKGKDVIIKTLAGEIKSVGTHFRVTARKEENMNFGKSIVWIMVFSGIVNFTNPFGGITLIPGELGFAEENSAPQKQVESLANKFKKYYHPVQIGVTPKIPQYDLPLKKENIVNYTAVEKYFKERHFKFNEITEELLLKNGFVVLPGIGSNFVSFYTRFIDTRMWQKEEMIPIFITSDTLLHLYHLQFDKILREIEEEHFILDLEKLSSTIQKWALNRYENSNSEVKEALKKLIGFFNVGLKLLNPNASIHKVVEKEVMAELENIENHNGFLKSALFTYNEDYSQYVPRGHYTRSKKLKRYFKAMMWYGRMVFLIKGGEPYGPDQPYLVSEKEARIQTLAALLLTQAMNECKVDNRRAKEVWERIYSVTSYFVGLSDDLTINDYQTCFMDTFGKEFDVTKIIDENNFFKFKVAIAKLNPPAIYSGTGEQIIINPKAWAGIPSPEELDKILDKTKGLRFMGQRFTPDSYIMGKLVYPTIGEPLDGNKDMFTYVISETGPKRGFPRGLDVMSILGSKRAKEILHELKDDAYEGYEKTINELSEQFEKFTKEDWNRNLYRSWLYTLKSLLIEYQKGYQTFMTTKAWQTKCVNTALGSWSQLRHDTILYTKQPYGAAEGEYEEPIAPHVKGYVEPIPEFYARLLALTVMTKEGLSDMNILDKGSKESLEKFEMLLKRLLKIAEKELANKMLDENDNKLFNEFPGLLIEILIGEEGKVDFLEADMLRYGEPLEYDTRIIADVFTSQITKEVLEEATGKINNLIVAFRIPDGRIILGVGPVFSYYEFKQPMENRLTDEKWRELLDSSDKPKEPEWVKDYMPMK
jgi:hypothetical protein